MLEKEPKYQIITQTWLYQYHRTKGACFGVATIFLDDFRMPDSFRLLQGHDGPRFVLLPRILPFADLQGDKDSRRIIIYLFIYHQYNHRRVKIIPQFTMVQHKIQCTYHLFKFNNNLGFCSYSIMAHVVFTMYNGLSSQFHTDRMVGMPLFNRS